MDPWEFRPPVLVGERVVWLGSGSGIPQGGVVKWIGKLPEMGPDWTVGMELDNQLPYGGIDGNWGNRHLFSCRPRHGLIVPITSTLRERDLFRRASHPGTSLQHGSAINSKRPERPKRLEQSRQLKLAKQIEIPIQAEERIDPQLCNLQPNRSQFSDQLKQTQHPPQTQQLDQTKATQLPDDQTQCQLPQQPQHTEQPDETKEINLHEEVKETETAEQQRRNELIEQLKQIAHQQRTQILQEELSDELSIPSVASHLNDAAGEPSAPTREEVFNEPTEDKLDDDLPLSLPGSSDQWSSATESPVPRFPESPIPQSPESRSARGGSKRSTSSDVSNYSGVSCRSSDTSEVERLTEELTKAKGLADFKACLQAAPGEQNNMNTLGVNRLLRRLEAAIAGGQHVQAAGLARDLARQKISCSVTRQRRSLDSSPAAIMVDMYVEDKVSHQGPIPLQVTPTMTVAQLKQKVEQEFEIPAGVQRWILGKLLAADDAKTLEEHNVNASGCPMFLYLVVPDGEQESDAGSAPSSIVEQHTQVQEEYAGPPLPAPPGKGWYYNYEEDHYSHCEDSDEDLSDGEVEALRVASPTRDALPPVVKDIPLVDDEDEDDDDEEDDDEEEVEVAGVPDNVVLVKEPPVVIQDAPRIPRLPEAYTPVAGSSKAITVRAAQPLTAVEAITKTLLAKVENKTGTLKLGWKCPVCTLVNAPTRPGCAACTTERPAQYIVPTDYRANQQEMQRLEREQQHDNDMQQATAEEKRQVVADQHQHYLQLVNLDKADLVPNSEPFDCSVCLAAYGPGEGTVLRECLHIFCRPCLLNTVQFSEEAEVKCPYRDANYACDSVLQEREIKALVPKTMYEQHLAKSVAQAENKIGNAFHCKTPDCRGWCIFEDNLNEFRCPVCVRTNCLTCQAIHDGINCKQYQEQVKQESETNIEARRTKDMLEDMVYRGEAMKCPTCQVILMKKWGCDWLRCSMCKTEICWVTRGPRWGPGGKGDTTGGCQCGLLGIKCHPRCNYCH